VKLGTREARAHFRHRGRQSDGPVPLIWTRPADRQTTPMATRSPDWTA